MVIGIVCRTARAEGRVERTVGGEPRDVQLVVPSARPVVVVMVPTCTTWPFCKAIELND